MNMTALWGILFVIFLVLEVLTPGNVISIWFMAGSAVSAAAAFLGLSLPLQLLIFAGVSLVTVLITRPFMRHIEDRTKEDFGVNGLIGKQCAALTEIPPAGTGSVKVNGTVWRAESLTGSRIPEGTPVVIERVDGNRLIVIEKDKLSYTV